MSKIQRTWDVNGKMIHEDQVGIWDVDDYLRAELLSPLEELFLMMHNHDGTIAAPIGVAGRIGEIVTGHAQERMHQVFHLLRKKQVNLEVIIATNETPGVPAGTLIAVEVQQDMEVTT